MGIYIKLLVNFNGVDPGKWEEAYLESLTLLEKFPAPLMRLRLEVIDGHKRYVYSSSIRSGVDANYERWRIYGDMTSYQRGEEFSLYRRVSSYGDDYKDALDKDVLWADEEHMDNGDECGRDIFGGKTQGYPYHLAVLAVGLLFENRFPGNIFVFGDIERGQVDHTLEWMNTVLDKETPATPVCFDAERLWERLHALYSDEGLALRRYKHLFRGSAEEELKALLALCDSSIVMKDFKEGLNRYSRLSQFGAKDLISKWLGATGDLRGLIELVRDLEDEEGKKKFKMEMLLEELCGSFVTFDFKERDALRVFSRSTEGLTTAKESIFGVFAMMKGAPKAMNFYMNAEELLELFCSFEEDKRESFEAIIKDGNPVREKFLKELSVLAPKFEKKMEEVFEKYSHRAGRRGDPPEGATPGDEESYLIREIQAQTKGFLDPEETAKSMGERIRDAAENSKENLAEYLTATDRDYLLTLIYRASSQSGFALSDAAWAEIDKEENIEILKMLMILSLIKVRDENFWKWRIYLMERKDLWPLML